MHRVQFDLWDSDDIPVPRKELLQKVKGVDGLLCVLTEKIDAELLDAAGMQKHLKSIELFFKTIVHLHTYINVFYWELDD